MHSYEHRGEDGEAPDLTLIESLRFHGPRDLAAHAEVDRSVGWKTWPEVWHLDPDGQVRCYFQGSTPDSIRAWAHDPTPLHRSRSQGLRSGGCTDRWVIVDSRPVWLHPQPTVEESDAMAFVRLRRELALIGIWLLDAVIFDDQRHWWSLQELTSGSMAWAAIGTEP